MELNIAEILKDKPKGTKLYTPIFGEVKYDSVLLGDIKVLYSCTDRHFYMDGKFCMNGECLLFPSKEMRDWSKFAWKKGDVLISNNGNSNIIFIKFTDDTYTHFKGKHLCENSVLTSAYAEAKTMDYSPATYSKRSYINLIEKSLGGKFNLETLEIEKEQIEFKDGDILASPSTIFEGYYIFIYKHHENSNKCGYYVGIDNTSDDLYFPKNNRPWCTKNENIRYATNEEKQKLFTALNAVSKRWNAEKKVVEDTKKEYQFQPFEKVLVRDNRNEAWRAAFFSYINEYKRYVTTSMAWKYCVPYEGNEHLLGTNKDVEE